MNITKTLEKAALAAGHVPEIVGRQVWINGDYHSQESISPWEPHRNNAQSFALMIACDFRVEIHKELGYTTVDRNRDINVFSVFIHHKDHADAEQATRYAIVRAAARVQELKTE